METKKSVAGVWDTLLDTLVERLAAAVQPGPAHAPELLTAKELAARLRVSEDWIYTETAQGNLPCYSFGRNIRFSLPEVLAARARDQQKN